MHSTELNAWQCKNCNTTYLQKSLADWCCSDEASQCAWGGCKEPRDKNRHSCYCTSHSEQYAQQRALDRLMKAQPLEHWGMEDDNDGPFCFGESWYDDIEQLVDHLAQDPYWKPEEVPEWEYCVELARPSIDLRRWLENEDEVFTQSVDDCDDLSLFPLTTELYEQIDRLQLALNGHWRAHTSGVWVIDYAHRWPLRQQILEWIDENVTWQ